jgi:hypothetical protein
MESNAQPEQNQSGPDTTGFIIAPMAAAAALHASAFSKVNASEAAPATWQECDRKAWEYYVEEPIPLPADQVIHLKRDAPAFSPRGNPLVLPAFQSIALLRDYRRAEQAIAKRRATPIRLLKEGSAFGQKMVMPDHKLLEQVRDMVNKMDMKSGLLTNSTNHKVRTATLGKTGRRGIITPARPMPKACCWKSSNAETWTPLNGSDLTMRLYGFDY